VRKSRNDESDSQFLDKDPIYRTHSILCRTFEKKVTLRSGSRSETNCRGMMWVNFDQKGYSQIMYEKGETDEGQKLYALNCGHVFRAAKGTTHDVSKVVPCLACGAEMAYWSHSHEWSHIWGKSNPFLYRSFIDKYAEKLKQEGYSISSGDLNGFLYHLVNALDDIRVNSLQEHVYPGAAHETWKKWKGVCERNPDLNENFIAFIFGVALEAENVDPFGPFGELIPEIKAATDKVRLKGPASMLIVMRWFLDRCVRKLLQNRPPQQQGQGSQPQSAKGQPDASNGQDQSNQGNSDSGSQQSAGSSTQPVSGQDVSSGNGSSDSGGQRDDSQEGRSQQSSGGSQGPQSGDPSTGSSSSARNNSGSSSVASKSEALQKLAKGADSLCHDEGHHSPALADSDPASKATTAATNKALTADIDDDDDIDSLIQVGQMDADVADSVAKLQRASQQPNVSNFILSQAKARILLTDVRPEDVADSIIDINSDDRHAINRMRAAFARAMGRERYKMDDAGSDIDVSKVIQYLMDPSDDELFSMETVTKGFAYRILGDMSGSMKGKPFNTVCRAHEMLKAALDYPFVQGDFWGFRGAELAYSRGSVSARTNSGEIWLYRYHPDCRGYKGKANGVSLTGYKKPVPVECGGLTPMHSAIHVALKDLHTQTAAGMAKRMFVLTDGYPTQSTTSGKSLSREFLQDLVAKEIRTARQKGIQVYSFVIGTHISDDAAIRMFGPRRFWRRAENGNSIGQALVEVVLSEFVKYLKGK
jgi:hypothetical protein